MQQAQSSGAKAPNENLILKTCEKKVKEDVRLIHENLYEMLKLLKMEDDKVLKTYDDYNISKMSQADMDSFEIQIRTSNIIKSAESLSKIISDLKDLTILNDFKSLNAQITNQCAILKKNELEIDMQLTKKKDLMVKLLHDLQHEYYTSKYK